MADLEFVKNKKLSWGDQMSVIVGMLVENGDEQLVEWIIDVSRSAHYWQYHHRIELKNQVISMALAAREEIVLSTDGEALRPTEMEDDEDAVRNFAGPSEEATEKFQQHGESVKTRPRRC
jgi:replication fork protection complex subunit Tof1/Swi1